MRGRRSFSPRPVRSHCEWRSELRRGCATSVDPAPHLLPGPANVNAAAPAEVSHYVQLQIYLGEARGVHLKKFAARPPLNRHTRGVG